MARTIGSLPESNYVVITPYLLPADSRKKVNVGDGFILDSAVKLIGTRPRMLISSRASLTEENIELINSSRCVIAVGANTLKDDFELAPRFCLATLERVKVPVILMGVGHYGVAEVTRGLRPSSVALLSAMLERFPFMSVRCDASARYVRQALPEKSASILMTSCPVVHQVDDIDFNFARKQVYEQLVVTVTDRAMLQAQLPILQLAKQMVPAKRRILALHQDYNNVALWRFAADQGYDVFRDGKFEPFLSLYERTDIHFGNRVHAHLKCLSLGVVTFLTPFDLRQLYFAESLDFPLMSEVSIQEWANYDFARAAARRAAARRIMETFVAHIRNLF